jgi:peroxiredoxin
MQHWEADMAVETPICNFGWKAPDFTLKSTDGHRVSFADIAGKNGTLVMFICNHCPYVKSVLGMIIHEAQLLQEFGVGVVAINANDPLDYAEDSFENMQIIADRNRFPFPYLLDETQEIAKAYGAVCTPDFFGFDAQGGLQYRGRLDGSRKQAGLPGQRRELFEAMKQVAETGHGPAEQIPSIGCSIKWKGR